MGFAPTWLRQVSPLPLLHKTTLTTDLQAIAKNRSEAAEVTSCGRRSTHAVQRLVGVYNGTFSTNRLYSAIN